MKRHCPKLLVWLFLSGFCLGKSETFHVEQSRAVSFAWVEKLVNEAVAQRHEFLALNAQIESVKLGIDAVSVWQDPQLGVGPVFYDSDRLAPSRFGDIGYFLRQPLPKRNEKSLLQEQARFAEKQTSLSRQVAKNRLRREIYRAVIRDAELTESVTVLAEDIRWIQTMVTRKEDRFKVQQAGHNDLMALQNERGLQELRLQLMTNDWQTVRFRIHRLLNRPQSNSFPKLKLPFPLSPIRFVPDLVALTTRRNPELELLRNEIDWSKNNAEQARLAKKPRWSLQAEAKQYSGDGGFREGAFLVGVTLPWFNRKSRNAQIAAREALVNAAQSQLDEATADIEERLHAQTLKMKGVDDTLRIHRDEIQLRRQEMAASAQSAWEVNRGSLDELLALRRQLIGDRLKIIELTAQLHYLAAEILYLAGVSDLSELPRP